MSDESQDARLRAAFGAEVAEVDVGGPPPFDAVMANGAMLRTRRRVTAVSGVAALAVLPVAAVAVFAGGDRPVDGAVKLNSAPAATGTHSTVPQAAAKSPTSTPTSIQISTPTPTPSLTVILPQQTLGGNATPPDPADDIKVVASGTVAGQSWRLVRDQYVVAKSGIGSMTGPHLPMSRRGSAGTFICNYTGLQWGSRPPGTQPDFGPGGSCGTGADAINGELSWGPVSTPGSGPVQWVLIGRVSDAKAVASVSLTIGDQSTPRQAVVPVAGEQDGYYVIFVPALSDQDEKLPTSITSYDAAGHSVGVQSMG